MSSSFSFALAWECTQVMNPFSLPVCGSMTNNLNQTLFYQANGSDVPALPQGAWGSDCLQALNLISRNAGRIL
jgi:hypothetical protein